MKLHDLLSRLKDIEGELPISRVFDDQYHFAAITIFDLRFR
jgi:hypothetical protein